ncbi:thiamine pyrophosphate-binding protein [Burkholderia sp. JSH-S8]|nr:thiamine pyrophosphate-binding protein [Burkholderia sp. JSH-S8]
MISDQFLTNEQYRNLYRTPDDLQSAVTGDRLSVRAGTTETVSSYLNKRLAQIGVKYVMSIPGDYIAEWVETLDDSEVNAGLVRVHPNNEMCATYAADGYARAANGRVGCLACTYGVGSLNAAQAVAGALVESIPLVVINGSPSVAQFDAQRDLGILWHHMVDGGHTDLRIFQSITTMAVRLDNPATAPALIDAALVACITESKPVYIEMALQIEACPCEPVPDTPLKRAPRPQSAGVLNAAVDAMMHHLLAAKRLVVLGGVEIARYGLQQKFVELLALLEAPYVSDLLGKTVLSEYRDDIRFSGVYNGRNSQPNVTALVDRADVILAIGSRDTDFNFTGLVSADSQPGKNDPVFPSAVRLAARADAVWVTGTNRYWGNVDLGAFLDALIARVTESVDQLHRPFPGLASGTPWDIPPPSQYPGSAGVTWDSFKSLFQHEFLARFDEADAPVVLADTGLTFYSLNNLKLPESGYIGQLAWGAIGYTVGANYGAKLANAEAGRPQRRAISICGDGAFSESVNALGTIAQLGLDSVVFVMVNGVFAIEQWLINAAAFAHDAPPPDFSPLTSVPQSRIWDYVKLAEGFGGVGYLARTNEELNRVLDTIYSEKPINRTTGQPTFTLVGVALPAKDLPSNTRWKVKRD